jgi:hypothetical protein
MGRWGDGGLGVPTLWGWGAMGNVRGSEQLLTTNYCTDVPWHVSTTTNNQQLTMLLGV